MQHFDNIEHDGNGALFRTSTVDNGASLLVTLLHQQFRFYCFSSISCPYEPIAINALRREQDLEGTVRAFAEGEAYGYGPMIYEGE